MIKKNYFNAFIILLFQSLFLIVKNKLGAYTPDEILYTTGEYIRGSIDLEELSIKFYVTYLLISNLYNINEFLFPILQIFLTVVIYINLYNQNKRYKILKQNSLLIFFLLPSALYFSSAFLRDYIIYLTVILLIFSYKINRLNLKTILLFVVVSILRYEAGIIIILSYVIVRLINKNNVPIFKVNILTNLLFTLLLLLVLSLLLNISSVLDFLQERFNNPNKESYGFSVWQVEPTKNNILIYSLLNWFAYYASYLFADSYSLFSYFMLIDSFIVGFLFFRFIFRINSFKFKYNRMYQISYFVFLGTFFISLFDRDPSTMFRHRMAYLPFLIYLNFAK